MFGRKLALLGATSLGMLALAATNQQAQASAYAIGSDDFLSFAIAASSSDVTATAGLGFATNPSGTESPASATFAPIGQVGSSYAQAFISPIQGGGATAASLTSAIFSGGAEFQQKAEAYSTCCSVNENAVASSDLKYATTLSLTHTDSLTLTFQAKPLVAQQLVNSGAGSSASSSIGFTVNVSSDNGKGPGFQWDPGKGVLVFTCGVDCKPGLTGFHGSAGPSATTTASGVLLGPGSAFENNASVQNPVPGTSLVPYILSLTFDPTDLLVAVSTFTWDLNMTASADATETNVPEPATLALIGGGLFGMGLLRRRRRN